MTQEDSEIINQIMSKGLTPLSAKVLKEKLKDDVLVLDTRKATEFTSGFIPGSIFIGGEGRFPEWAGNFIALTQPIILVTSPNLEEEIIRRLINVGFNNIMGYLKGGFKHWKETGYPIDMIIDIEPDEMVMDTSFDSNLVIVDVRTETEFAEGHIKNSLNLPLAEMTDLAQLANFEENDNLYIHCADGYRSTIACSLFKKQGIHNLRNVLGGWEKIKNEPGIKTKKDAGLLN